MRRDKLMTCGWTTENIDSWNLPMRSQPIGMATWSGAPNRDNGRKQYYYLLRGSESDVPPFTMGGEIIPPKMAFGIGQKYGQRRIIVRLLTADGLFMDEFACHLATKWGLDEHGWYAAAHYTVSNPHLHIIAETEHSTTGDRLDVGMEQLKQWKLHAENRATQVLKVYRGPPIRCGTNAVWRRS